MNSSHDSPVLENDEHWEISIRKRVAPDVSDEDVFFAKERFKLHQSTPNEGVDVDILKKYFSKKYGF